jgi:rod shape-determining protein MreC
MPLSGEATTTRSRGQYSASKLLVSLILSFGLIYLDYKDQYLNKVRSYISATIYPLYVATNAPKNIFLSLKESMGQREKIVVENQRLKTENIALSSKIQKIYKLEKENRRLHELLDSKPKSEDVFVLAEIIAENPDPFKHRIIINKGSKENVQVNQSVADSKGIIGHIIRDQIFGSEVLLITDPEHAIPIEVARTGLRSIALGTGSYEEIQLSFLAANTDIQQGDILLTSGLGEQYPSGYPVAVIETVSVLEGEPFLEVLAKPLAKLTNINEVWVIQRAVYEAIDYE